MSVWQELIRTGNLEGDKQRLEVCRNYAAAQGLELIVRPLPEGGFHVEAVPRASPYGPPPGTAPQAGTPVVAPFRAGPVVAVARTVPADHCEACRRHAPTKNVTFMQNVGCLIVRFPKTIRGNLCRLCISRFFWRYTLITFFFGWWGVISFFYSLVSIPSNIVAFLGARSLPVDFEGAAKSPAA